LNGQAAMHTVECLLECSLNCRRFHILTVTTLFRNEIKDLCLLDRPFGPLSQFESGSLASQSVAKSYKGVVSNPHGSSAAARLHRAPESSVLSASSSDARGSSYKDVIASAGPHPKVYDGATGDSYNPEVTTDGFLTVTIRSWNQNKFLTPLLGKIELNFLSPCRHQKYWDEVAFFSRCFGQGYLKCSSWGANINGAHLPQTCLLSCCRKRGRFSINW
jgi:hypothetical protein